MASHAEIRDLGRDGGPLESDGSDAERRRVRRLTLWFYLGVPLLRRLRSPLWLTLFCGQILAGYVLTNPVLQAYRRWLKANVHPDLALTPGTTLPDLLQRLPTNSVLWIGTCLLFFHALRMPPFGYRPERRGTLLALEAEGHYLRVHTDKGSDLILYRLCDAMKELSPGDGAQVHRSWWVRAPARLADAGRVSRNRLSFRHVR